MTGWIARKLRAGRYSMNLQLLEADLQGSSVPHRASVVVAAAAMIAKVQADDIMMGMQLDRAILDSLNSTMEAAQSFYNILEDLLTTTEEQRKQVVKHTKGQFGLDAAQDIDRRVRLQQQGIRLLLVALARQVDDSFKAKARKLREALYESHPEIEAAVAALEREDLLLAAINTTEPPRNYDVVRNKAKLFSYTFVGW